MIGIGFVRTIAAFSLASMIITPGARAAPDVPATGTTLPLKSGEYVLKFADGKCGALSMTPQNEPISARTWIGGCRYGLAEGPGLLRQKDGSYIRATARHGIIDTNTGDFAASYHTFPDQIPQQFILYASAIGLEAPSFDPDFVFSAQQSSDQVSTSIKLQAIKRPCPGWTEAREFVPVKVTINGTTGSTGPSDVRNIVAQCGPVPGKSAPYSVRMAIMEGNRHLSLIWSSETSPGARSIHVTVCSAPDCRDTWRELTAPYRQQWLTFIEETKARTLNWQRDVDARYAPLEAERLTQWRALAARYATRPRPPVGTLTPRPVAKSPAKKGRRN